MKTPFYTLLLLFAATATQAYLSRDQPSIYNVDYVDEDWWYNDDGNHLLDQGYTITATKQLKIWSDVFQAAGQRARLVNIWESQLANTGRFNASCVASGSAFIA